MSRGEEEVVAGPVRSSRAPWGILIRFRPARILSRAAFKVSRGGQRHAGGGAAADRIRPAQPCGGSGLADRRPRWSLAGASRPSCLCGRGSMSEAEQQLAAAAGATQNGHEAAESSGEQQQADTGGAPAASAGAVTAAATAGTAAATAAAGAGPTAGTAGVAASQNGAEGDQINASKNEEDAG